MAVEWEVDAQELDLLGRDVIAIEGWECGLIEVTTERTLKVGELYHDILRILTANSLRWDKRKSDSFFDGLGKLETQVAPVGREAVCALRRPFNS
jgi:hypothetical protein